MKNVAKNKKMAFGIIFVLALVISIGIFGNFNKPIQVYAATVPYNDQSSTDGVRIDGWRAFRDMTTYGENNDNGCGYTAMEVLS